jgi:LacI family transcriptional regulator
MTEPARVVDVAHRAQVSIGTVSNVLNNPARVAPATRKKVLRAIEELGFVRNEAARQLRAGRSRTIGLVILDVGNPFFTDVAAGVESAAAEKGLSVILCNSGSDADREAHYLSLLQEQRAYGILITPLTESNTRIEELRHSGTPVVLVDRGSTRRQCSVSVDDVAGGEFAVAHLIGLGHRRIAFVGGPADIRQVANRLTGARNAAAAAAGDGAGGTGGTGGTSGNVRIDVIETTGLNVAAGRRTGEQIATTPTRNRPTAVFCANDLLALGVLQEMTRRRISVPGDLAIVGYDDIDFAEAAAVPLTSVRQPRSQLGRAAAELLIEEVSAPERHQHRQVVFEPELVVRESSGVCC